ncbi:hypothetical protein FUA23_09010 [Neolewinella aurantiaca]|uniref:Uncharacterized protein n=1 Tax=Neolewinella aurantiaca TaxID=2602767 RepID=A0A5C7FFZ9_9BACT|nr:hypothetical protein [Neolewinella aurantiaca]TXF89815.1 hypothetical protein FUA23_09010 [Neolewinella aurantiaca]
MPILLLLLGVFFPRIVIVFLFFFTGWFRDAFDGYLLPILGFLFLPITLLWYGIVQYFYGGDWTMIPTIGMVVAVLLDLGLIGGGARSRR